MHDVQPHTVQQIVPFIIKQGLFSEYRFVTVSECLGDASGGWATAGNAKTLLAGNTLAPADNAQAASSMVQGNNTAPLAPTDRSAPGDQMNLEKSGAMTTVNFSVFATLFMSALYMLF